MKTFLDYYNIYKNDKSARFSLYYVVKGKSPVMYFGLFKNEEDLNTTTLKDNWSHTGKIAYLNREDAEKALG